MPECTESELIDPCPTLAVPDECVEVPETTDPCHDAERMLLKPSVTPDPAEDSPGAPFDLEGPEL
jgi:hypothetical protein